MRVFHVPSSKGRSSIPSSALLGAGNLVNIRSTEIIVGSSISRPWTPYAIFLSDSNDLLWECWYNLSNLTKRRVYQELIYWNKLLKKWLQTPLPFLSTVSSHFIFMVRFLNSADTLLQRYGHPRVCVRLCVPKSGGSHWERPIYFGAMPFIALWSSNLYAIRCLIGSQSNWRSTGVICSELRVLDTKRAAKFWTYCSLSEPIVVTSTEAHCKNPAWMK